MGGKLIFLVLIKQSTSNWLNFRFGKKLFSKHKVKVDNN